MSIERVVGLHVSNEEEYQKYRQRMEPILISFGGSFGYDFKIETVLRSKTDNKINRVFTIEFPSMEILEKFFSSPDYLSAKNDHFDRAVESITEISLYEKSD